MMKSKKSAANDLFLLMLNLSQMATKESIINVFIGAIEAIWPILKVKYLTSKPVNENNLIQISTEESTYGFLHIENLVELDIVDDSLVHNSCGMLAVILKKIEQDLLLSDEKLLLQKSVQERTLYLSKEIEERKKIEEELKQSEEKFRSLFENINAGVALHEILANKDGKPVDFVYLDVNPTYEKLTTLKKEDIVGKRGLDVIPNLEQKWIDLYGAVALTGKSVSIIDHSDFLDKYWDIKAYSPSKNQFAVALTDITDKIKAEQEIFKAKEKAEETAEKYKLLHENAGLGIGYYDPDGIVISFNSIASKDMHGVPADFAGKSVFDLFPKDLAENYFDRIQKAINTDEIAVYEDFVQLPTQKKWFLSTYTKIVNSHATVLGIQIISQNITAIKQSEVELKNAKEKAEESDRLKSSFLANMSHEIRTPMNGILGFTSLLKEPGLSGDEQNQYISIIEKSGNRMLSTIQDIIDISRIESGQIKVSISDLNLNHKIDELFEFFEPEVKSKNLQLLITNKLSDEHAVIKSDQYLITSVLTNLIKNAIKYTHEGKIEFGFTFDDNGINSEWRFQIKDTGIGIKKEDQNKVFDRFLRAKIENKRIYEGTGLGLAISKSYIEMLEGKIWVESELGKGSTFYFTIPS